eukprot:9266241-Alexandrium_andersonii.AAC.1
MAACPQAGPKTRASADGQRGPSRCTMVMSAGGARVRTPLGAPLGPLEARGPHARGRSFTEGQPP